MASMTGNMWNSYHFMEDLDVCLNPYGKDAYGDYSIDNSNHKKKKKKTNNKVNTNHKYHLDEVGIWDIGEYTGVPGEYALVQIVNILTNICTVIPQYQVKILDGKHKDKILTVFENEAIEQIDPTPYLSDHLEMKNKTSDFACDIEELKTDISDLRTNINDLMRDHVGLRGDILAIKPSGDADMMFDNDSGCTISSFAHELENKVYDIKDLVDHEVSDIKEHIELQETEIKKVSKVSKLSLLNNINNWLVF
jgi:hypothetical protein